MEELNNIIKTSQCFGINFVLQSLQQSNSCVFATSTQAGITIVSLTAHKLLTHLPFDLKQAVNLTIAL